MDIRSFLNLFLSWYWGYYRFHPNSFTSTKLSGRFQLRMQLLPPNHIIKSFLELKNLNSNNNHWLLLEKLTPRQQLNIKDSVVGINNRLNRIFPSFNPFSTEFSPGDRLINIFSSHFYFHSTNRKSNESRKVHIHKLDKLLI